MSFPLLFMHNLSDAIIAISFFTIALGIVWYMRHRRGLLREYRTVAWLFCGFILAAGLGHLLSLMAVRYPIHGVHGAAKIATALFAAAAVIVIWPLLSRLATLPSSGELAAVNDRLRQEAEAHEATLRELDLSRRELEARGESEQRRLTEELATALQRYETALRGSHVTVYTQDRELRYTTVSNPMFGRVVDELIGRHDRDILPDDGAPIVALKRGVIETGQSKDGEFRIEHGGKVHWYDTHIEPLRDIDGEIVGLTCAAVDITGRKAGEAHLRDIMRELTHRSKNLLAVIQAMARQTARHTGTIETFLDQFSARVQALAASHDLLVQESWYGASLSELIRSQLGHYLDRDGAQVSVKGPALLLKPEAAQSLSLAIHELATNAAKYGGLSVPNGRVAVQWRRLPVAEGDGIEITWAESGGPGVTPPQRRGFGSLVIERNLARSLDADIKLEFPPDGARCRMLIPAANLAVGR